MTSLEKMIAYRIETYEHFSVKISRLKKRKHDPERKLRVDVQLKKTVDDEMFNHSITAFETDEVGPKELTRRVLEEVDKNILAQLTARERYYFMMREKREANATKTYK